MSSQEDDAVGRLSTIIGQDADICRAHLMEKDWNLEEAAFQFYEDREQNRARNPETKLPDRALEARLERQRRRQRSLWVSVLILPPTGATTAPQSLDCCVEVSMGRETIRSRLTKEGNVENFCLPIPSSHDLHIRIVASSPEAEAARIQAASLNRRSRYGKRMSTHQPAAVAPVAKVLSRHTVPVQQLVGVVDGPGGQSEVADDDDEDSNATPWSTHQLRSFSMKTSALAAKGGDQSDNIGGNDDDDDLGQSDSSDFTVHVQWTTRETGPLMNFVQNLIFHRYLDMPIDQLQEMALSVGAGIGAAPAQAVAVDAADRMQILDGGISSMQQRAMELLGAGGGEKFGHGTGTSSDPSSPFPIDVKVTVLAVRAPNETDTVRLLPVLSRSQLQDYMELFKGSEDLSLQPLHVAPRFATSAAAAVPLQDLLRRSNSNSSVSPRSGVSSDEYYCLACVRAAIRRRAQAGRGAEASPPTLALAVSKPADAGSVAAGPLVDDGRVCSICAGLSPLTACAGRGELALPVSVLSTCLSKKELRELVKTQLATVSGIAESKGSGVVPPFRFVQCPNDACGVLIEFLGGSESADSESKQNIFAVANAEEAFRKLRVRCAHCGIGFCTQCGANPYHLGLTCKEYLVTDGEKVECRFCGGSIQSAVGNIGGQNSADGSALDLVHQSRILEDMIVCQFDGVSQFIDVPVLRTLSHEERFEHYGMGALTVEAWIRPGSSRFAATDAMRAGYSIILSYGGDDYSPGFALLLRRSPNSSSIFDLIAQISTTQVAPAVPNPGEGNDPKVVTYKCVARGAIDAERWTHVALSWSVHQEEIKLFKNGTWLGAAPTAEEQELRQLRQPIQPWSKLSEFGVHLTLGGGWNQQHFHGHMAEVRVWAQSRSEWQLRRDMCTRKVVDEPNLLATWPLCDQARPNSGSDTRNSLWQNVIVFDRSGNQNHGMLHSCGSLVSDRMVVDVAADVDENESNIRGSHFRKPVWQLIPEETFNADNSGSLVTLGARTAEKQEKEWKLGSVVLQTPVESGRVRWWFRINSGLKTTLGVVTSEYSAQHDSYINKGPEGWGYYQENGNKGHGAPATEAYGVPFAESCSVVTVDLDASNGVLRFYVNGVDQGIAFRNLPSDRVYHAALSLYNAGDSVSFLFAERLHAANAAFSAQYCATSSSPKLRGIYEYLRGFPTKLNAMFYLDALAKNGWDTPDAILELAQNSAYMVSFRFNSEFRKIFSNNGFRKSDKWPRCACNHIESQEFTRSLRMWKWAASVETPSGADADDANGKHGDGQKPGSEGTLSCYADPRACLELQRQRREEFYARAYHRAREEKLQGMRDRRAVREQKRQRLAEEQTKQVAEAHVSTVSKPSIDPEVLAKAEQLVSMGFHLNACVKALEASSGNVEGAALFLIDHPEVVAEAEREAAQEEAKAKAEAAAAKAAAEAAEEAALRRKLLSEEARSSPRPAAAIAPTTPWSCASCTYINEAGVDICHMCGESCNIADGSGADLTLDGGMLGLRDAFPEAEVSGASGRMHDADSAWHCQLCTFENPSEFLACKVCGNPKIDLEDRAAGSRESGPKRSSPLSKPSSQSIGLDDGRMLGFSTSDEEGDDDDEDALLEVLESAGELPKLTGSERLAVQQSVELDLVLADAPTAPLSTHIHAFRHCCRNSECTALLDDACPATLSCGHPCGGIRGETKAQTHTVVPDEIFAIHITASSDPNFLTCTEPNVLTAMPGNGPKVAIVDFRLTVGRSEWTVLYDDAIPGEEVACFGVVTAKTAAEPRPCSVANFRVHAGVWMYVARTGSVYQNGILSPKTMEKAHKGDRITMILNQREGSLALCINNLFQGIIFEGITEPVFPTFIFENGSLNNQDPERIKMESMVAEEAVPGLEPSAGSCLPCLHCDLKTADEYCLICYCDSLSAQPCIQLQCGHVFHAACVRAQVDAGYPGIRISFKYLKCPVCNEQFKHWSMEDLMRPALQLESQVSKMALQQLRAEGMQKHPSIVEDVGGDFYNDPLAFALHEYVFYKCFKCQRPYFGGNYRCNIAEGDDEEDHADLVCPRCSLVDVQECPQHGKEWIAFKCRFCCTLATYTCWGNTHFCANCHAPAVWKTLVKYKTGANIKREPSGKNTDTKYEDGSTAVEYITCPAHISGKVEDCPLKVMHPPNGEEFGLGCTLCRDEKATVDVRKKMERDGVLEFLVRMKALSPEAAGGFIAAAKADGSGGASSSAGSKSGNDRLMKLYDNFHLTRGLAKAEKNKLKRVDMVKFLQRHAPSEDWLEVNNLSIERQQKVSSLSRPRKKKERQRLTRFYIDMLSGLANKAQVGVGGSNALPVEDMP